MMKIHYFSDKGYIRDVNEDSMLVEDLVVNNEDSIMVEYRELRSDFGKFIVADGMGGYSKGEIASRIVVEEFLKIKSVDEVRERLDFAKKELDRVAVDNEMFGSTVAGVVVDKSEIVIFNSGDCRVYRYDKPFLEQLSKDHSVVQKLVDRGEITHNEMRTHKKKNLVTSALFGGKMTEYPEVYLKKFKNRDGLYLICSDGVWEAMDIEEMESCFEAENILLEIKKRVLKFGANDNFSMILVEVSSE